jgi:N-acetylmuramoyl-L-alanine amidase
MRRAFAHRLSWAMLTLILFACTSHNAALPPPATAQSSLPGSPSPPRPSPSAPPSPKARSPAPTRVPKPAIVWRPIPFPDFRKTEMASYALRHYALDTYRLTDPQAIVEHYTAAAPFSAVWNGFASNSPDLGELPGTCAHFVVDTDGTIYQLVPLTIMCRHASGMNWTAFGIEMIGFSDRQILDRPRQLEGAQSLTLWLMATYAIELRNVIGHNENLMSPLRKELVESFRCQTHGDWMHADMEIFRAKLASLAKRYGVTTGPPPRWVDIGC